MTVGKSAKWIKGFIGKCFTRFSKGRAGKGANQPNPPFNFVKMNNRNVVVLEIFYYGKFVIKGLVNQEIANDGFPTKKKG